MIRSPFNYVRSTSMKDRREPVLKGDLVKPDQSLSIREIIDRFTRGVPAVGVAHFDYDDDPDSLFDADYVFPDFPDFADYVEAEMRLDTYNRLKQEAQAAEMQNTTAEDSARHSEPAESADAQS